MWNRKSILFLCLLLWFVFPSTALCQGSQINPVKIYISPDSTGVRVTSIPLSPQPVKIRLPNADSMQTTSDGESLTLPFLSPEPPTRCWVRFSFSGTCWNWRIRKPGNYTGKILTGSIQSNLCVLIDFRNFDRLRRTGGSDERLDTYYALSAPDASIANLSWMSPSELNAHDLDFPQPPTQPAWWALWQEIGVSAQNTSADYRNNAVIGIKLHNQSVWVDSVDSSEIQNPLSDK